MARTTSVTVSKKRRNSKGDENSLLKSQELQKRRKIGETGADSEIMEDSTESVDEEDESNDQNDSESESDVNDNESDVNDKFESDDDEEEDESDVQSESDAPEDDAESEPEETLQLAVGLLASYWINKSYTNDFIQIQQKKNSISMGPLVGPVFYFNGEKSETEPTSKNDIDNDKVSLLEDPLRWVLDYRKKEEEKKKNLKKSQLLTPTMQQQTQSYSNCNRTSMAAGGDSNLDSDNLVPEAQQRIRKLSSPLNDHDNLSLSNHNDDHSHSQNDNLNDILDYQDLFTLKGQKGAMQRRDRQICRKGPVLISTVAAKNLVTTLPSNSTAKFNLIEDLVSDESHNANANNIDLQSESDNGNTQPEELPTNQESDVEFHLNRSHPKGNSILGSSICGRIEALKSFGHWLCQISESDSESESTKLKSKKSKTLMAMERLLGEIILNKLNQNDIDNVNDNSDKENNNSNINLNSSLSILYLSAAGAGKGQTSRKAGKDRVKFHPDQYDPELNPKGYDLEFRKEIESVTTTNTGSGPLLWSLALMSIKDLYREYSSNTIKIKMSESEFSDLIRDLCSKYEELAEGQGDDT